MTIDGFRGEITGETSSHFRVVHEKNREGEMFAKRSKLTNVFRSRISAERLFPELKLQAVTKLAKQLYV